VWKSGPAGRRLTGAPRSLEQRWKEKQMNQAGRLPVRLLMAAACTFALAGGALTGQAPAHAAVCAPYQHITVHGTDWIRSPDNFGGGNACLNQPNGTVSFTVKSQTAPPPAENRVAAYPHLTRGCEFPAPTALGDCTRDWTAKPVTKMTGSTITWTTSHTGVAKTAKYNTGADLWFSATPQFSAPVTEVMFWQNVQGLKPSAHAVKVRKDGFNWWYWTEPASSGPFTWTEVIFMRTHDITSWTKMPIQPLLNYAVLHAAMDAGSYWVGTALGFELWNGGGGLKTTSGWIHQ
jgi:hypothetical protein